MILGAIFSFFKRALTLFIRVTAWLIVALSLWIPLLFVIGFFVFCLASRSNPTDLSTVFWSGLAVSFVAAFFISGYIYDRRRLRKKRNDLGERVAEKSSGVKLKKRAQEEEKPEERVEEKPEERIEEKVESFESAGEYVPKFSQPIETQFNKRKDSFETLEDYSAIIEEPKVFATRKDPTIFIYEYSDRLEYYKRTREGLVLMETRQK